MEPQQSQQAQADYQLELAQQQGRLAALTKAIRKIHPAGVQYLYNGEESPEGMYLLAPLVYSLVVQTLALKFERDGKWYGDYKINRHTNPYYQGKAIKAELIFDASQMRLIIGKDTYLYLPLGKPAVAKGKKVAKAIKAKSPETFAQMLYAKSVSDMMQLITPKQAEIAELPLNEQLAIYSQVFARTSENMVLFAISGEYPELTPAYQKKYNEDIIATKKAQLEILKEAHAERSRLYAEIKDSKADFEEGSIRNSSDNPDEDFKGFTEEEIKAILQAQAIAGQAGDSSDSTTGE